MSRLYDALLRPGAAVPLDMVGGPLRYLATQRADAAVDKRVANQEKRNHRLAIHLHSFAEALSEIMERMGADCESESVDDQLEVFPPEDDADLQEKAGAVWPLIFQHLELLHGVKGLFEEHGAFLNKFMQEQKDILSEEHVRCVENFIKWLPGEIVAMEKLAAFCKKQLEDGLQASAKDQARMVKEWEPTEPSWPV